MASKPQIPRILLGSGIFSPDVGGPATHVRRIAEHLHALGWQVTVVAFGDAPAQEPYRVVRVSRGLPKALAWPRYAFVLLRASLRSDALYAFDLTTAGLPLALAARALRKPLLLRIGGDPLWERQVERGRRFLPMRAYYEQGLYREDRPILFKLLRFVVRSARVVVTYGEFLEGIYTRFYGVAPERMRVIKNPLPTMLPANPEQGTRTIMFAGRFVSYKNLPRVLRVFREVSRRFPQARLLLVGDGPEERAIRMAAAELSDRVRIMPKVDQAALMDLIRGSSVALAPALTEFNPNFVLEALSLGRPALISHDNGLSVAVPDEWTFDPLSDESLRAAMERMLDEGAYERARSLVLSLSDAHGWEGVLAAHEELLKSVLPHEPHDAPERVLAITGDRRFGPGHERYELQRAAVERLEVVYWGKGSYWPQLPNGPFDVVTAQDPFFRGLFGWFAAKRLGARFNVQVHADLAAQTFIKHVLAQIVLRHADSIRVVSQKLREQVERIGTSARTTVLPIFIDTARFRALVPQPHEQKTILWIGRFEEEKDPLRAIEILKEVRKAVDAKLVFLGTGTLEQRLKAAAQGLSVEFAGWSDPASHLPVSDIVLSTSREESYGASIIEALAAGVPVVAPDVGIAREAGAFVVERERLAEAAIAALRSGARSRLQSPMLSKEEWMQEWKESL